MRAAAETAHVATAETAHVAAATMEAATTTMAASAVTASAARDRGLAKASRQEQRPHDDAQILQCVIHVSLRPGA